MPPQSIKFNTENMIISQIRPCRGYFTARTKNAMQKEFTIKQVKKQLGYYTCSAAFLTIKFVVEPSDSGGNFANQEYFSMKCQIH